MRWCQDDCLSQIVLAHALRQATVWHTLSVRQANHFPEKKARPTVLYTEIQGADVANEPAPMNIISRADHHITAGKPPRCDGLPLRRVGWFAKLRIRRLAETEEHARQSRAPSSASAFRFRCSIPQSHRRSKHFQGTGRRSVISESTSLHLMRIKRSFPERLSFGGAI